MRFRGEASPSLPWPIIVSETEHSGDEDENDGEGAQDEDEGNALMERVDSIGPAPAGISSFLSSSSE